MAAITWRNIDAPSFQGASAMFSGAQQSIDNGLGKFADLLKQRETLDAANWDNTKNNNTQAFLDQLTQYRTPEELKAAQEAGALDQLRQQYGAQIDRAAVRGAEDARLGALQQRALTGINYTNTVADNEQRPLFEQAMSHYARGDTAAGDAIIAANPGMRKQDVLATGRMTGQRAVSAETRAANADSRAELTTTSNIATATANQGYLRANTDKILAEAAKVKTESSPEYVSAKSFKERNEAVLKDSYMGSGVLGTPEGDKALFAGLKALGMDADKQQNTVAAFTQLSRQKGYEDMPVGLVLSAAANRANDWFGRWEWNAVDQYKEDLKDPTIAENLAAGRQAKANLLNPNSQTKPEKTVKNPLNNEEGDKPVLPKPTPNPVQLTPPAQVLSSRFVRAAAQLSQPPATQEVGPRVQQLRRQVRFIE